MLSFKQLCYSKIIKVLNCTVYDPQKDSFSHFSILMFCIFFFLLMDCQNHFIHFMLKTDVTCIFRQSTIHIQISNRLKGSERDIQYKFCKIGSVFLLVYIVILSF